MTESIPTIWNDERDATFFGMTETLAAEGFAEQAALLEPAGHAQDTLTTRIDKMLEDLVAAESWESMALRAAGHAESHHRDLVPVPVARPRRAAQ